MFTVFVLNEDWDFEELSKHTKLDDAQTATDVPGEEFCMIRREDGLVLNPFGEWVVIYH